MKTSPHAFPYKGEHYRTPGMELRDWFAGQALASLLGARALDVKATPSIVAEAAYLIAHAMMTERKKDN